METARLIAELAKPEAYPFAAERVEVRQTHISAVFLAGGFAYKVKKPVAPAFLDFSTLAKRKRFCEEEVRLNRRLAPDVYLGVVPITADGTGVRVEGAGRPIEWAVKMRRLPDEAALPARLARGEVDEAAVAGLARRIAAFHGRADRGPRISRQASFDQTARNMRDNLAESALYVGTTISGSVYHRLRILTEDALAAAQGLISRRVARNVPCDGHGDLRLEHVYLFPDRAPPADLVVIDCVEFSDRYRIADPASDAAFLVMDLIHQGRRDLARMFADAYFEAAGDDEGRALLPLFTAYRAAVRGKVDGIRAEESEVPAAEREAAGKRARGYWLLALGELEEAGRRPALVLTAGLPGTGKSTLAHDLAEQADFYLLRTDVIRKELAGRPAVSARRDESIYTPEWDDRTYAECRRRAEELLLEGRRVVLDGNLRTEARRRPFLELGNALAAPTMMMVCRTSPEVVRERLARRTGDASDADWTVHQRLAAEWEEPTGETLRHTVGIDCDGTQRQSAAAAIAALDAAGLYTAYNAFQRDGEADRISEGPSLLPAAAGAGGQESA